MKHQQRDAFNPDEVDEIVNNVDSIYRDKFTPTLVPGVAELLTSLKAKGVLVGLVTGTPQATIDACKAANKIFQLFDVIVTGETGGRGKPFRDPYDRAVKMMTEKIGRIPDCYVVENAPLGIKSAKSAELVCFGVKGSSPLSLERLQEAGADFVCKDIKELAQLLVWIDSNLPLKELLPKVYPA